MQASTVAKWEGGAASHSISSYVCTLASRICGERDGGDAARVSGGLGFGAAGHAAWRGRVVLDDRLSDWGAVKVWI